MLHKSLLVALAGTALFGSFGHGVSAATMISPQGTIRCLVQGGPAIQIRTPEICPPNNQDEHAIFSAFTDEGTIVSLEDWSDPYADEFSAAASAPVAAPVQEELASRGDQARDAESLPLSIPTEALYSLADFESQGVVQWGGYKFTYYSQSVLPGGGLAIPGRHVNDAGYVADGDGYIVLASSAPNGTVFETPFGYPGKVYDAGVSGNHLDVYIR